VPQQEIAEKVGVLAEEVDFRKMARDEAIAYIMDDLKVGRVQAEFILALELGETEGDATLEVQD
jgi:hypothetical protein